MAIPPSISQTGSNTRIRKAVLEDAEIINHIYNLSIPSHTATADMEPIPLSDRVAWLKQHLDNFPVFVIEYGGQGIIGWISFSPYRQGRLALRYTAEISYYIHADHQGKGVGSLLMDFAVKNAPGLGFKNIFAIVLETNTASLRLLEKFNFRQWAYLPDVADFDGRECSHVYFGLRVA